MKTIIALMKEVITPHVEDEVLQRELKTRTLGLKQINLGLIKHKKVPYHVNNQTIVETI